jgi:hypothetical protein
MRGRRKAFERGATGRFIKKTLFHKPRRDFQNSKPNCFALSLAVLPPRMNEVGEMQHKMHIEMCEYVYVVGAIICPSVFPSVK